MQLRLIYENDAVFFYQDDPSGAVFSFLPKFPLLSRAKQWFIGCWL